MVQEKIWVLTRIGNFLIIIAVMKYMFAGMIMETNYNIGDTITAAQLNEDRDYRVVDIDIDEDGNVGYSMKEIIPIERDLFIDEREIN